MQTLAGPHFDYACQHIRRIIVLSGLIIFLAVGLLFCLLSACSRIKTVLDDEDYVEVTGLRIDKAEIYMSPAGGASTYQLNVEILPANATNRKLKYYIFKSVYQIKN